MSPPCECSQEATHCAGSGKLLGTIASIAVVNPKEKDLESGSDLSDSDDDEDESDDDTGGGLQKRKLKVPTRDVLLYRTFMEERVQQLVCESVERLGKNGRGAVLDDNGELDRGTPWGEVQGVADFLIMWCGGMKQKNEKYM